MSDAYLVDEIMLELQRKPPAPKNQYHCTALE